MEEVFSKYANSADWQAFLNRPSPVLDRERIAAVHRDKRVFVTGAGGSIGSALTLALAEFAPGQLVLLDSSESNLYEIGEALQALPRHIGHVSFLGSVCDETLLREIFLQYQPQIIYHAAAFKHVPLMEQNPFAAIENNALGTLTLAEAARSHAAEQLILLSTDKAADPISIMGASKRLAEQILLAAPPAGTRMKAVRLGNVIGSEGSIVPLFLKQIEAGQPVRVTHPEVRRYFLTVEDAVTLLLQASTLADPACVLVPDLGQPIRVEALARFLMRKHEVPIEFTALRPGDKMCEALLSGRESYKFPRDASAALHAISSPCLPGPLLEEVLQQLQAACRERSLERLISAVCRAVPEYQPSTVMQMTLTAGTR